MSTRGGDTPARPAPGHVAWMAFCLFWSGCWALAAWHEAPGGLTILYVLAAGASWPASLIPIGTPRGEDR